MGPGFWPSPVHGVYLKKDTYIIYYSIVICLSPV